MERVTVHIFRALIEQIIMTEQGSRGADPDDHDSALYFVSRDQLGSALSLRDLCTVNRINSLSAIKGAEHGWLGASWSSGELLTFLHARDELPPENVVLAKGHGAAMQYAALYSQGHLEKERLYAYKDGTSPLCLEAHADLVMDTGSLGQCLSKVAGIAVSRPNEVFAVILGDGELQEGQVCHLSQYPFLGQKEERREPFFLAFWVGS